MLNSYCGLSVIVHEHPVMLMACWLAPVIIIATRIFCMCIILSLAWSLCMILVVCKCQCLCSWCYLHQLLKCIHLWCSGLLLCEILVDLQVPVPQCALLCAIITWLCSIEHCYWLGSSIPWWNASGYNHKMVYDLVCDSIVAYLWLFKV